MVTLSKFQTIPTYHLLRKFNGPILWQNYPVCWFSLHFSLRIHNLVLAIFSLILFAAKYLIKKYHIYNKTKKVFYLLNYTNKYRACQYCLPEYRAILALHSALQIQTVLKIETALSVARWIYLMNCWPWNSPRYGTSWCGFWAGQPKVLFRTRYTAPNQSINQSSNQAIKQSTSQKYFSAFDTQLLINQSIKQSTNH